MRFVKFVALIFLVLSVSCSKRDLSDIYPEYKLIKTFSKKIKTKTNLVLSCYGVNNNLPKEYQLKNGLANFSVSYALVKTQKDTISLEEARSLLVSIAESFLQEINSSSEVRSLLDVYPFSSDLVSVYIYFRDENSIGLGNGISTIYFSRGKIEYKRYEISEYRSRYPAIGKHFTVHEESYAEALDIVKKQGTMMDLSF
jgi:hypothetical protein